MEQSSQNTPYLLLHVNPHLKWKIDSDQVMKELRFILSKFKLENEWIERTIKNGVPLENLKSNLTYVLTVWDPANHINNKLEVIQKLSLKLNIKITKP